MNRRVTPALVAAFLLLMPVASHAGLSTYSQNFEAMSLTDPAALSADGWLVYGNVFSPDHSVFFYGYGPFPAPNPGGGFCALDAGQGGPPQGQHQLSVYSDYNNLDHGNGNLIESNVYKEQTVAPADVNGHWVFKFDAKLGNLAGATTALAFIKTLNPAAGYALTNFIKVDMTAISTAWGTYSISINVTPGLVGQIMQFGFANTATFYQGSGVYYDNVSWTKTGTLDVAGNPRGNTLDLSAATPNPFASSTRVDFTLAQRGPVDLSVYDISGRRVATLFHGEADAGPHTASWDGRSADGGRAPAGVYQCLLQSAAGRRTRAIVLTR